MMMEQQRRYARHIMLDEIGEEGQQKLLDAKVLVIGAGGLGSAALSYLAAAGVGKLGVVDFDHVEESNLQRQIMHEHGDIGRLKVESAADRLSELNPECHIDIYAQRLKAENAAAIIKRYDIVLDGTDNFETRSLVAKECAVEKLPLIHAAVAGFSGYVTTFTPYDGVSPSYECFMPLAPNEPNKCSEVGVLGPMAGVIGAAQATEAVKVITGAGDSLRGKLLHIHALNWRTRISELPRADDCAYP